MVDVAQSVRALDCGSKGRGFESHLSPKIPVNLWFAGIFVYMLFAFQKNWLSGLI